MLLSKTNYTFSKDSFLELALYGFILSMPFSIKANSILIIVSVAAWLLQGNVISRLKAVFTNRLYLLFVLLYSFYVAGLFYSSNIKTAYAEVELKITILILPILFFKASQAKVTNRYLIAFVLACFLAAGSSLLLILYKIYFKGYYHLDGQFLNIDWVYFSYHLPKQIDFHAPYFSMYIVMSMLIMAWSLGNSLEHGSKKEIVWKGLLFLFFLLFSILLSSRTSLLAGILILIAGTGRYFILKKSIIHTVIAVGLTVFVASFLYFNTPYLRRKVEGGTGVSQRQQLWQAGVSVIKDHYITGVGSGDTKDMLAIEYKKMGLEAESAARMDPHNQYIQILLALGIFGFLTYLACLLYMFSISIRNELYLLTAFVILYTLCGLTEGVFNTQKGLIFFAFFSSILAFRKAS